MFENFGPIDIEEEATRRQALIDEMWARDDEEDKENGEKIDEKEEIDDLDL